MFLGNLNDNEKRAFLSLAHAMMSVDGNIAADELHVFQRYSYECEMANFTQITDVPSSLQTFSNSSLKVKKIVIVELWGIIAADGSINIMEVDLINQIGISLCITDETMKVLKDWMLQFLESLRIGSKLIAE